MKGPGLTVWDLGSNPPSDANRLSDPELITIFLNSGLPHHKMTLSKVLSCLTDQKSRKNMHQASGPVLALKILHFMVVS